MAQHLPLAIAERVCRAPRVDRERGIDHALPVVHATQRIGQLLGRSVLQQIARDTGVERPPQVAGARERREDDDLARMYIYLYTASLGLASNIQNVYYFMLVIPLILFHTSEWRKITFCVLQPFALWGLLLIKGGWFIPQTPLAPETLAIINPSISFTASTLLFGCCFFVFTRYQKNEMVLIEAQKAAEANSKIKDEFLATISHEIRTPMNGILGMLQLMLKSELPAQHKENLNIMKSSSDLLMNILNDILDFSKFKSAAMVLHPQAFKINEILESNLNMIAIEAAKKNIELVFEKAPHCPIEVIGDGMRFSQILLNLLNNAVKFTSKGEITLQLWVESQDESNITLKVSVKDTGIGISPKVLGNLFHPFSQADSSTTRKYGGTGLGLAICKELCKLMGGKIWAESIEEKGSTFFFTAKFLKSTTVYHDAADSSFENKSIPEIESTIESKAKTESKPQPKAFQNKSCLVVEDNRVNQLVILNMLKSLGFIPDLAENGREAIDKINQGSYEIIFMDCQMPVMDGYECTKAIRLLAAPKNATPILAVTANNMDQDREKCLAAGMDEYLSKPVKVALLVEMIHKILKS